MRFASIGGSNAGNYAAAGKAVADSSAKIFDTQRKTGPDYTELSKTAMKTQAAEKIVAMQTAAQVTKQGIKNLEDKTKMQHALAVYENKKDIYNSKRKAGTIAALGKIGGAAYLASRKDDREYPTNSDAKNKVLQDSLAAQRAILDQMDANDKAGLKAGDNLIDSNNNSTSSTTTGGDSGKVSTGGGGTSQASSGSILTGNAKVVLDAIAGPESGTWGYQAFNQGGSHGGTRVVGKSGSHKEVFGEDLTNMTLSEIFRRQNMGGSDSQFRANGGLHAVGRYQFIGSTLQDEVKRMGLDPNTKFTPEIQDRIALSHIKRVGNISPWVGPSTKWSQSEKDRINGLIQGL